MKWTEAYVTKNLKAIQRVRELHKPNPKFIGEHVPCLVCKEDMPCSTIQALDGNNDSSR